MALSSVPSMALEMPHFLKDLIMTSGYTPLHALMTQLQTSLRVSFLTLPVGVRLDSS